ncbi:MAG: hypothetical protein K9M40_01575 [Candidatus Pacebacteria bacterium]|nr:hypothetical protein [Candidatus Paceibacterota bacterium]
MFKKIKYILIETDKGGLLLVALVLLLMISSSFVLGRLSKSFQSPGISLSQQNFSPESVFEPILGTSLGPIEGKDLELKLVSLSNSNKSYFASKKGKKYYPVGCSAGKSIKIENRVYFSTEAEAKKAGYEMSSSCK